jgi:hypothetical protein
MLSAEHHVEWSFIPPLELGRTLLAENNNCSPQQQWLLTTNNKKCKLKFTITTCNSNRLPLCIVDAQQVQGRMQTAMSPQRNGHPLQWRQKLPTMAGQKHVLYKLPHSSGKYVTNQRKRLKATKLNDFATWEYIATTCSQQRKTTAELAGTPHDCYRIFSACAIHMPSWRTQGLLRHKETPHPSGHGLNETGCNRRRQHGLPARTRPSQTPNLVKLGQY